MYYREVIAKSLEEARSLIKRDYGDSATMLSSEDHFVGGVLGFGRKKLIKVKYSVSDDIMLKKYKEGLGIPSYNKPLKKMDNLKEIEVKNEPSAISEDTLKSLMSKLDNIEQKISGQPVGSANTHTELLRLKEILKENEFYDDFINEVIDHVECSLSLSQISERSYLHKIVINYILNNIKLTLKPLAKEGEKKVVILIGPTGVGKTTTVAKLAANSIREKLNVELITIDGFRIGAKYQLEKYAEYMSTPMSNAEDNLELQKIVDLSNADLILVDTIGRSQQDEINIAKMKKMLELQRCDYECLLTISAVTKPREVSKIFKSFEVFDFQGVIITKLDESETFGALLNETISRKKTLRYLTDGQKVPNDIKKAGRSILLERLKGFDPSIYFSNDPI